MSFFFADTNSLKLSFFLYLLMTRKKLVLSENDPYLKRELHLTGHNLVSNHRDRFETQLPIVLLLRILLQFSPLKISP